MIERPWTSYWGPEGLFTHLQIRIQIGTGKVSFPPTHTFLCYPHILPVTIVVYLLSNLEFTRDLHALDFICIQQKQYLRKILLKYSLDSSICLLFFFQAFSAFDKEDTGFIKASDFGQVLKDFCYKLTDNQYHCFLRKLRIHLTPYINWKYFLQNFNCFLEKVRLSAAHKHLFLKWG